MKKFLYYAFLMAAITAMAACGDNSEVDDEQEDAAPSLVVLPKKLTFDATAGERALSVAANVNWSATYSAEWLSISPSSGTGNGTVTVTVAKNPDENANRNGTITFSAEGVEESIITIVQNKYGTALTVSPETGTFSAAGGTLPVEVASNGDAWEIDIPADAPWLSYGDKTANEVTFTIAANEGEARTATATIKLTNYPTTAQEIIISQAGKEAFYTLTGPSTSTVFDLGAIDDITFVWDATNTPGETKLMVSTTATGFSAPLQSVIIPDGITTAKLDATVFDIKLFTAGVATGATTTLYWTLEPVDASITLTKQTPVRTLKLKRPTVKTVTKKGDMLDVVFNPDTTATDVSDNHLPISYLSGTVPRSTTVAYNRTYQRYEAFFNPATYASTGADVFYYNYSANTAVMDNIANGHSTECLIKLDRDYAADPLSGETKFFSTMGSGGTGFLIRNQSAGNWLSFLSHDGGYKFADAPTKPDGVSYYHLVGVYDKANAKVILYVNGTKVAETAAPGNYVHPGAASRYFCIGGDAGSATAAEGRFIGSILIARMFNEPLTASEVTTLWNEAKP
ncbi:MAG: hypothetical protein LBR06_09215 [Bacteroidales bacterium]|jgi:hypothetical protein|nr:hypothetical protein [Bacteroidales bacterium]